MIIILTLPLHKRKERKRKLLGTLATFREVWKMFTVQTLANYSPGENIALDEQLKFRRKCPFRHFIKGSLAR